MCGKIIMRIKKQIVRFAILGILFLVLTGLVYAETRPDFQVPAPPAGELLDTQAFTLGGRGFKAYLYKSDKDEAAIAEYYQRFFKSHDFENILDEIEEKQNKRLLRFKKEDLVVGIALMPKAEGTEVVISEYLQPAGSPPPEKLKPSVNDLTLPQEDQPGKDLKIIPRPPQGIRWMSMDTGKRAHLMYATPLGVGEVVGFYKANMPDNSWEIERETATRDTMDTYVQATGKKDLGIKTPFRDAEDLNEIIKDSYVLDFKSGYGRARITVFPNFMDRRLGSLVQIVYGQGD